MKAADPVLVPSARRASWSGRWVEEGRCKERMEGGLGEEEYRLEIGEEGVRIAAGGKAGAFYAGKTLEQLRRQSPPGMLPEGRVEDGPRFAVRGYYLDVSRGRVPRLARLMRKVEGLAELKINRLYLYMEHPFRFTCDPDIADGGDAFGAEDIRALDAFCRERFIELVPSFSCFGHMGKILSLPQYRALAEAEFPARSWEEASWLQRLRGATIDAAMPESRSLLERLLGELLPCFSSGRFHLCGDETHDLGKKRGVRDPAALAALYAGHVRWVAGVAARYGKGVQLWGDVLRKLPGALAGLPEGAEVLDWAYFPSNVLDGGAFFAEKGTPVMSCPSVRGFGALFPAVEEARDVVVRQARAAAECGAMGVVNTDWGDYGHFTMPPCAWHGIALGAQAAWNPDAAGLERGGAFDGAFSRVVYGDAAAAGWHSRLGSLPPGLLSWPLAAAGGKPAGMTAAPAPLPEAACAAAAAEAEDVAHCFAALRADGGAPWVDGADRAQLVLSARFAGFAARWAAGAGRMALSEELEALEEAYAALWKTESLPCGWRDIRERGFRVLKGWLREGMDRPRGAVRAGPEKGMKNARFGG